MASSYKELVRVRREKSIEASLPAPLGDGAIEAIEWVTDKASELSIKIGLLQVCLRLAAEGTTRAMVAEVTDKVGEDYGVWVLPSVAGQIFNEMGVRRVSVHGQRRLVIDAAQLQPIHDGLVQEMEELRPHVEEAERKFAALSETVEKLYSRAYAIFIKAQRERSLRDYIVKNDDAPSGGPGDAGRGWNRR